MDGLLGFACLFLKFLFSNASGDTGQCFDASKYLKRETGIGATKFWGSKTLSVEHCMKLCVRQSRCKSINFDLKTRMCELNNNVRDGTQKASDSNVYSEFQSWPPEVDEMCYSRPCKENEVCIPKSLLITSDDGKCSYSCMQFSRPVCPLPKMGTFNGRTVGSVNIVKCPNGMKGEGRAATCKNNLKWEKTFDRCVGFRFRNKTVTKKYLETNHDGKWKQVSSYNWNWKKTQVACRDLLDLEYGGSIRLLWQTESPKTRSIAVDIDCNGTEKTLGDCIYNSTKESQKPMMVLTCFKSNISDGGSLKNITLSSEKPPTEKPILPKTKALLWVKFWDTWSPVGEKCNNNGHKWNKKESKVACRSMFPDMSNTNPSLHFMNLKASEKYVIFICQGDEPHLFHCKHRICDDGTGGNQNKQVKLKCN